MTRFGPPKRSSCAIACSRTVIECSYTSLWWWCSSTSSRNFGISGSAISASPVSTKIVMPVRGCGDIKSFVISSRIRSAEIISSRLAISFIATTTSGAISKLSWLAKRAARNMRSGSSLNESSGLPGVRRTFFAKSTRPSNGSINTGSFPVSSSAMELTVKSRRERSPSIEFPYVTSGLRDSLL